MNPFKQNWTFVLIASMWLALGQDWNPIKAQSSPMTIIEFRKVEHARNWVSIPEDRREMHMTDRGASPWIVYRYLYDSTSTTTDNGGTTIGQGVIKPGVVTNGRWFLHSINRGGDAFNVSSINYPTRTVNTTWTPSTTKYSQVTYTVTCTSTNPLLAGTSSSAFTLDYSTNGGSSWQPVSGGGNSNGVGVAVAVALTNGQTGVLSGWIPANALVRVNVTNTGTASGSVTKSQEVIF